MSFLDLPYSLPLIITLSIMIENNDNNQALVLKF